MYDLIGDIHGHAEPLKELLLKLGYKQSVLDGWSHSRRKVIFLGDFIDRGPAQVEVVDIAKCMVDSGNALAVMGNHEFNAVSWATPISSYDGSYLRPHSDKNLDQHRAYLEQVVDGSPLHQQHINWFRSLPVFLDLPAIRVVHACWHQDSLDALKPFLDDSNRIKPDSWATLATKGTKAFDALEVVLKGMESPLPEGVWFADKGGHVRHHARMRWWWNLLGEKEMTWRDLAMLPADQIERLPHSPAPAEVIPGYHDDKPVFVGHYWMTGSPQRLTKHVACLDYSIAAKKPGKLVAYRWQGESVLSNDHFEYVEG